jgi:hypothetical protein
MIMLAETEVSNGFLGSWVGAAIIIVCGLAALLGIIELFATKREVTALEKRLDATDRALSDLSTKLDRDKDTVINAGSERAKNLHIRIDELQISLGTTSGQTQAQIGAINGQLQTVTTLLGELVKAKIHAK